MIGSDALFLAMVAIPFVLNEWCPWRPRVVREQREAPMAGMAHEAIVGSENRMELDSEVGREGTATHTEGPALNNQPAHRVDVRAKFDQ